MFWSFAAPKGGVGVSVLAAATAAVLAQDQQVTLVDFCGDQPDIFGCSADPVRPEGVSDWLSADASVVEEAVLNLSIDVSSTLRILPMGTSVDGAVSPQRCQQLVSFLGERGTVVADVGVVGPDPFATSALICSAGSRTTLVVRACYLAMCRARRLPIVPDDIVEVVEGGRSLRTVDIEAVLRQPITSRLPVDPLVARRVDAGLLAGRVPRALRRSVGHLLRDRVVEGAR